jgi:uroporphyrinogen decarboxylase
VDSTVDLKKAASMIPKDIILSGNLDPLVLLESEEVVRETTLEILEKMRGIENFVFSTGCDIEPTTPIRNIQVLLETVRTWK